MSMKKSSTQKAQNSKRKETNNATTNMQNQASKSSKNSYKRYTEPEAEATTSAAKPSSNRQTYNLNARLGSPDRSETWRQFEQASSVTQQNIESAPKREKEEQTIPDTSTLRVPNKFRRGKSWIDSNDDTLSVEQAARRKSEELKVYKRSASLSNKIIRPKRESKKLKKENSKKKVSTTDETKKLDIKNQKLFPPNVTTATAEYKPRQKLLCQERSGSTESTATQILNKEPQIATDQFSDEKPALSDKSYTLKPQLVLHYNILSPQARSCLMLMNFLNLDLELRHADQITCQQLSEDFQRINAWHTIPKLVHNDLVLTDSHTILMYLCVTFSSPQAQELFPTCPLTRLKIMNMFFFEAQVLFRRYSNYMTDIVRKEVPKIDFDMHRNKIFEAYELMNGFLKNSQFLVGDTLTLADISLVATFSSLDLMFPIDSFQELWPQLADWFHLMREMPMYLPNNTGVRKQKHVIRSFGKCILPN